MRYSTRNSGPRMAVSGLRMPITWDRGWRCCASTTDTFKPFPRLGASVALLVPLSLAPLVLNLIAMTVQVLPVTLLLSSRSSWLGNLYLLALCFAVLYVALPNCREISANITNSQWVMALCLFLVLVASTPSRGPGPGIRYISHCCSVASMGPFCLFLLPIALFMAWRQPDRWRWVLASTLGAFCLVSGGCTNLRRIFTSHPLPSWS